MDDHQAPVQAHDRPGHDPPDHYAALGLARCADAGDVRKAYRRLLLEAHPDKGGDGERFRRITDAFETLSDEGRRCAYDAHATLRAVSRWRAAGCVGSPAAFLPGCASPPADQGSIPRMSSWAPGRASS
eukprot:CAMPEP_0206023486 /NCGR_PEP_ID=MMETSP1464-20131121/36545_1 /ASSEMBLY_ACC=CAM_ASM_001124 /TAXON_ID=119497 /ORGANISM="Exanthemachrysis gayraliae, Strain RCC1523" /LENGTH=128 /DNA_ID=CAMNT_0053397475 /DNA_START=27 /DNA_END=409 /DNA_ORIENTATION=-